jgi:hypothetical protein
MLLAQMVHFFCVCVDLFLGPLSSTETLGVVLDGPEVTQVLDAPGADGAVWSMFSLDQLCLSVL